MVIFNVKQYAPAKIGIFWVNPNKNDMFLLPIAR